MCRECVVKPSVGIESQRIVEMSSRLQWVIKEKGK